MELSVIIVNYKVKYFTELCLRTVQRALAGIPAEIIVVDNHSADSSVAYLRALFPAVRFIENSRNIGFGAANNQGAKYASGRYLLLLNPDTIVAEDTFSQCLRFMEEHPEAGALGVHMINGQGRFLRESKRSFPSLAAAFYKMTGLSALFPHSRVLAKYHQGHLPEHEDHAVEVLAGACMLIRKEVWDLTGGFDEDYFMYGEDIDLSWRILQAGYRNYYFSGTTVVHFKGRSAIGENIRYIKMFYGAMDIFARKHFRHSSWFVFLLGCAIRLRAGIALIDRTLAGRERHRDKKNILLAGSPADTGALKERLQTLCPSYDFFIPTQEGNNGLGELERSIRRYKIDEVIFCPETLSFKGIIAAMQRSGIKVDYLFQVPPGMHIAGAGGDDYNKGAVRQKVLADRSNYINT